MGKSGILLVMVVVLATLVYVSQVTAPAAYPNYSRQNTLQAKEWNNGKVHIWHTLDETTTTFTDVADGTRCTKLDDKTHRLIGPPPPIFYYHVNCNGVIGYVEVDQLR